MKNRCTAGAQTVVAVHLLMESSAHLHRSTEHRQSIRENPMTRLTFAFICLLVTGCSSQASLLVSSQPAGAYITEVGTGTSFGIAPTYAIYSTELLRLHPDGAGCFLAKGLEARWVSGVHTKIDPLRICGNAKGNYTITLVRDPDFPGLDKDLEFAVAVQASRAQQQAAQAASDASLIAAYSAIQQTTPVRCTSVQRGDTVQTKCH